MTFFSAAMQLPSARRFALDYPSKYYAIDTGIRNSRLNFRQDENTHLMENAIYNELIRRDYAVDVGVVEMFATIDGKAAGATKWISSATKATCAFTSSPHGTSPTTKSANRRLSRSVTSATTSGRSL